MSGRPSVGVGKFVWKDNKFLMGKRVGKHGQDTWSVPGGYLEYGESFEEAAKREVLEETGVEITNLQLMTVTNNLFPSEQKHTITVFMSSLWQSGQPAALELDKFVEIDWFTYETMPENLFVPVIELKKQDKKFFVQPG